MRLDLIYKNVWIVAHYILFTCLSSCSTLYYVSTNMSAVEVRFTAPQLLRISWNFFMENLLHFYYLPFLCYLVWFMSTSKIHEIQICISLDLLGELCLFRTICYCSFHDFSHYPSGSSVSDKSSDASLVRKAPLGHFLQLVPFAFWYK